MEGSSRRYTSVLLWLPGALFALWLYRRAFGVWFLGDDFAWLGLGLSIYDTRSFLAALFEPQAQGTVRFLSERGFFLLFQKLFGLDALPYRVWVFANLCGIQFLLVLIVRRLSGAAAAALSPVLWAATIGTAASFCWLSSYNQFLSNLLLLAAFYGFLRSLEQPRWRWLAWGAFLTGFGALETVVVFPALVLGYVVVFRREQWRRALPYFVPSLVYTVLHFAVIPKTTTDPAYHLHVDASMLATLSRYWGWVLGPGRMPDMSGAPLWVVPAGVGILTVFLLGVAVLAWRAGRREVAFFLYWFLVMLGPVLPLRDHVMDYYLVGPAIGVAAALASGAGWLASRSRTGAVLGWGAVAILLLAGMSNTREVIRWYRDQTDPVRALVEGVRAARTLHPGKTILLGNIDNALFWNAVYPDPFRLFYFRDVYLAPGAEAAIDPHPEWGGIERWKIAPANARLADERSLLVVYQFQPDTRRLKNITSQFRRQLASGAAEAPNAVDVGQPLYAAWLSGEWGGIGDNDRWMGKNAQVTLAGPAQKGQILHIEAFCPAQLIASGPVRLTVSAGGEVLGSRKLDHEGSWEWDLPLPDRLVGASRMVVQLEAERTFQVPGDQRRLSLVFGRLSVRQPN